MRTAIRRPATCKRWRGPDGSGVSAETELPERWTSKDNVAWSVVVPGEGASSPIVRGGEIFLTSALENGSRRVLWCLDLKTGDRMWKDGRYGKGQVLLLENAGLLLVTAEDGHVHLVRADPKAFVEVASFKALEGKPFSYEGKFYRFTDVGVAPKPFRSPHPPLPRWRSPGRPPEGSRSRPFGLLASRHGTCEAPRTGRRPSPR